MERILFEIVVFVSWTLNILSYVSIFAGLYTFFVFVLGGFINIKRGGAWFIIFGVIVLFGSILIILNNGDSFLGQISFAIFGILLIRDSMRSKDNGWLKKLSLVIGILMLAGPVNALWVLAINL